MMVDGLSAALAPTSLAPSGWAAAGLGLLGVVVGWLGGVIADRYWPVRPAQPVHTRETVRRRGSHTGRMVGAAATGAAFVVLALTLSPAAGLVAWLFYAASGILLSTIDARHKLLPNRVLLPVFLIGVGLLAITAGLTGDWAALGRALAGAAALFAVYLALALISPAGMGMGDVKFAAVVGLFLAYLGWPALLVGTLAGFVVGALVGLVALLRRRASTVPFGPAMLAGSIVAAVWADAAARAISATPLP